jgi:hypothetical protein
LKEKTVIIKSTLLELGEILKTNNESSFETLIAFLNFAYRFQKEECPGDKLIGKLVGLEI